MAPKSKPQQVNFYVSQKFQKKIPNLLPLDVFFQNENAPKLFLARLALRLDPAGGAYDASRSPSQLYTIPMPCVIWMVNFHVQLLSHATQCRNSGCRNNGCQHSAERVTPIYFNENFTALA